VSGAAREAIVPGAALTAALRGFVRGRLGDHADGDDVVQETFVRLFSYDAPVGNVKALCFAIARNLLLDHGRAARRVAVPLDDDMVCPQPTAETVAAYRRAVTILAGALERMPPLRREVFLRRRLDGLSTAEIALGLDMSLAAVEKHVVRAFRDLRLALARRGFTMEHGA
jgi:RNA polymerase sigma factor (sigma-70 family)